MHLVILKYQNNQSDFNQNDPAHADWLDKYFQNGIFLASGLESDGSTRTILMRSLGNSLIKHILNEDVYIKSNKIIYELFDIDFQQTSKGFESLMIA